MIPLKKENVECIRKVADKSVSRIGGFSLSLHDTSVLKGIAICAMLCHHLFYQSPESGYVVWHLAMLGKVCVAIFLMLSGYGLTIQMKKLVTNSDGEIRGGKSYASCRKDTLSFISTIGSFSSSLYQLVCFALIDH